MGQNSTKAFQNSTQPLFQKRKNNPPHVPPSTTPVVVSPPSSPSYVVAENKVLPNGVHDLGAARRQLRPVSQELTKFRPEYADMFQYSENDLLQEGNTSLVDGGISDHDTRTYQTHDVVSSSTQIAGMSNGGSQHARKMSASSDIYSTPRKHNTTQDNLQPDQNILNKKRHSAPTTPIVQYRSNSGTSTLERPNSEIITRDLSPQSSSATNLARSQSVNTGLVQPVKLPVHKRQTSIASGSSSIQDHVIMEDPREHLYNAARETPFSSFQPNTSSLPVRNTFDMDYSLNLTYAQLAEFRRNKRFGGRLAELEAEINAFSTVPKSPFDRQHLGETTGVRSISMYSTSTGSSETGMSRSKKKRAPEPPKVPHETGPSSSSVIDSSSNVLHPRSKTLQRSGSSLSGSSKRLAPQPEPQSASLLSLQGSIPTNQSPFIDPLPGSSATLPRQSSSKGGNSNASTTSYVPDASLKRSISDAKAQLEALDKLKEMLKKMDSVDAKEPKENNILNAFSHRTIDEVNDVKEESVTGDNGQNVDKESLNPTSTQQKVEQDPATQILHKEMSITQMNEHNACAKTQVKVHDKEMYDDEQNNTSVTVQTAEFLSEKYNKEIIKTTESPDRKMNPLLQNDIIFAAQTRKLKTIDKSSHKDNPSESRDGNVFEKLLSDMTIEREDHSESDLNVNNIEESSDYFETSKLRDDNSGICQSHSLSSSNKAMKPDDENDNLKPSFRDNESDKRKTDGNNPSRWGSNSEDRVSQLRYDADREDMSSAVSMDISKRSSIQSSEDMSISSSNTSQRVFSSDWAPEHDLDPDDDIMDEQNIKFERQVSSEGFKPSMIPPKIRDLKDVKMRKNSKKNKQNGRTETRDSSSNQKTAIGSIRKFKKSVHQSMKNVFGSISKASGSILSKQKSQEFLDNREGRYRTSSGDFSDEVSEVLSNLNWTLSSSRNGSLRHAVSDSFINQPEIIKTPVDLSASSDDDTDDDEIGDIDFANGLNDIPSSRRKYSAKENEKQKQKVLKHTGVAYVGGKGQIVILPQYRTVHVDENGRIAEDRKDYEGHAPKINKKKEKKYKYESTMRKEEKFRIEEALARMISEKEEQYEIERQRQKEIENSFRVLRDLEIKERKHRLEKESIQENMARLQSEKMIVQAENEVNNNALSMSSLNTLGLVSNGPASSTPLMMPDQPHLSPPYTVNGSATIIQPGYSNSSFSFSNQIPIGLQPQYNLPYVPTITPVQHIVPNLVNVSSFPATLLSGSSFNGGHSSMGVPTLTPQELAYLSDCMLRLGIPPPATIQQWEALLGSITYTTPESILPPQAQGTFSSPRDIPNHSYITTNEHTPHNLTTSLTLDTKEASYTENTSHFNRNSSPLQSNSDRVPQNPSRHQSNVEELQTLKHKYIYTNGTPAVNMSTDNLVSQDVVPESNVTSTNDTTTPDGARTLKLPTTQLKTNSEKQTVQSEILNDDKRTVTSSFTTKRDLPAKVYGPIGFRPVSFHVKSSR